MKFHPVRDPSVVLYFMLTLLAVRGINTSHHLCCPRRLRGVCEWLPFPETYPGLTSVSSLACFRFSFERRCAEALGYIKSSTDPVPSCTSVKHAGPSCSEW